MGKMNPCPECGGKLNATLAPLFGWQCPACHYVWLAKANEELNAEELRALLALAEENIEFEGERADKAEARVAELEKAYKNRGDWLAMSEDRVTKALGRVSELEARIKELERKNSELDLAAMCNADAAKMAEMERDELKAKVERVTTENTHLRAALATSKDPCIYCQLPAEEMGKCKRGFPGCARADDLSGCPEFGAAMDLHDTQRERDALRSALRKVWYATGPKEFEALVEPLLEEKP
jgi:hypothetical protein